MISAVGLRWPPSVGRLDICHCNHMRWRHLIAVDECFKNADGSGSYPMYPSFEQRLIGGDGLQKCVTPNSPARSRVNGTDLNRNRTPSPHSSRAGRVAPISNGSGACGRKRKLRARLVAEGELPKEPDGDPLISIFIGGKYHHHGSRNTRVAKGGGTHESLVAIER